MSKKRILAVAFISIFLVTTLTGLKFVNETKGAVNEGWRVEPKTSTKPPIVLINSLKNDTLSNSTSMLLTFDVLPPVDANETIWYPNIMTVCYETDWLNNSVVVYQDIKENVYQNVLNNTSSWSGSLNLDGIPQGNHSLTVFAIYQGFYKEFRDGAWHYYDFQINGSSTAKFVTNSPSISPAPSPTAEPTSTIEPTPTPEPQSGFLGTNLPVEYGYAIVIVLVIIVVAGLSLVYLKKLGKSQPKEKL